MARPIALIRGIDGGGTRTLPMAEPRAARAEWLRRGTIRGAPCR